MVGTLNHVVGLAGGAGNPLLELQVVRLVGTAEANQVERDDAMAAHDQRDGRCDSWS